MNLHFLNFEQDSIFIFSLSLPSTGKMEVGDESRMVIIKSQKQLAMTMKRMLIAGWWQSDYQIVGNGWRTITTEA